ncbi:MAG TPA: PHB depolymerase family esterase, partial [Microthrixaceae bacterium]|nr:PHB depolymerase family esterase [Microthrixaceae bacterium]
MSSKQWGVLAGIVLLVVVVASVFAMSSRRTTEFTDAEPPTSRPTTTFDGSPEASNRDGTGEARGADYTTCAAIPQTFPLPPRSCRFVAPADLRSDERLPAVILLHGFNTLAATEFAQGHWEASLTEHRFIVVLPEGQFGSWNAGGCCAISQQAGVDDVGYLRAVLDQTAARPDVDPSQISVVGNSNGGMMAYLFGCAEAGRLTGIASVEGTPMAQCAPSRPVPVLHVHGRADMTVPYAGGQSLISWVLGVTFPPIEQAIGGIATAMGCPGPAEATSDGPVTTQQWQGCPPGIRVELDAIDGAAHAWP